MASDSGSWIGDVIHRGARKLAVGPDGSLHGVCGNAAECHAYLRWVDDGMPDEGRPLPEATDRKEGTSSFLVLICMPSGEMHILSAYGTEDCGRLPYMALGSGAVGAMCAMAVGATAEEAVQAVIENASGAEGPVRSVRWRLEDAIAPITEEGRVTEKTAFEAVRDYRANG